jgi:hypothetical protein
MGYREHTPEEAKRFRETTARVQAAGLRKRKRTIRPTREDLERVAPPLSLCPHCLHWGAVKGLLCNCCGADSMGRAMNEEGAYDE